jgi:hypothetical protein
MEVAKDRREVARLQLERSARRSSRGGMQLVDEADEAQELAPLDVAVDGARVAEIHGHRDASDVRTSNGIADPWIVTVHSPAWLCDRRVTATCAGMIPVRISSRAETPSSFVIDRRTNARGYVADPFLVVIGARVRAGRSIRSRDATPRR